MASATCQVGGYEGRYIKLTISHSSGTTVHWTLSSEGGSSKYYTVGPTDAQVHGQRVYFKDRTYWDSYEFPAATGSTSGSITVAKGTTSVGATLGSCVYYGDVQYDSKSISINTYSAPSVTAYNVANVERTSAKYSATVNTDGATATGGCELSSDGGSTYTLISGVTSANLTNLTPNTTYSYRAYVSTAGGTARTNWKTFTTTGNAPSITSVNPSISVGSTVVNYSVSYDTNARNQSSSLVYGTTTSYGTTSPDGKTITTPQNNTLYYYKITVTDNFNRTSTYTGSFTSGGTAPIVNSQINYVRANKASIKFLPTYDTNAHFSSLTIQYFYEGESEQHTQTFSSEPTDIVLTNLKSNKYYTLKMSLTDNHDRTTLGTLYFKTPSGMKINNMVATEFKFNGHVILGMKLNGHILYE